MRKLLMTLVFATLTLTLMAQNNTSNIALPQPEMEGGRGLMEVLAERESVRQYDAKPIDRQTLSNLLWAANGVNRPESGKRTAPSALNKQDILVYVLLESGSYLYDAPNNQLLWVSSEDLRKSSIGKQPNIGQAPVHLVLVSESHMFGDRKDYCYVDAGIVSQNISLFCTSAGLATVPRGSMDSEALTKGLKLKETDLLILNHPVGYPQE